MVLVWRLLSVCRHYGSWVMMLHSFVSFPAGHFTHACALQRLACGRRGSVIGIQTRGLPNISSAAKGFTGLRLVAGAETTIKLHCVTITRFTPTSQKTSRHPHHACVLRHTHPRQVDRHFLRVNNILSPGMDFPLASIVMDDGYPPNGLFLLWVSLTLQMSPRRLLSYNKRMAATQHCQKGVVVNQKQHPSSPTQNPSSPTISPMSGFPTLNHSSLFLPLVWQLTISSALNVTCRLSFQHNLFLPASSSSLYSFTRSILQHLLLLLTINQSGWTSSPPMSICMSSHCSGI